MTTPNSLPQPAAVVEEVEAFIAELPATRRRKRTKAEIYAPDLTPEHENYAEVHPPIRIELDDDAQVQLPKLLDQLGRARNTLTAQVITAKILDLLGLEVE